MTDLIPRDAEIEEALMDAVWAITSAILALIGEKK